MQVTRKKEEAPREKDRKIAVQNTTQLAEENMVEVF